jgi:hypothetical protein
MEERRQFPRTRVHFEAKVTNLTTQAHPVIGRISDMSEAGVSVILPAQFAVGNQVSMETADSTITGNVIYVNPDADSQFRMGLEVTQVRLGTSQLSSLLQRTMLEGMPTTPGVELVETPIG